MDERRKGRGGFVIITPPDRHGERSAIVADGVQPKSVVEHFRPDLATYIGQYELLWSAAPMASYPELFRGRKVIHFIDNSGACAALIKGYASAIDCGLIVNAYHAMGISLGCNVYIAHVRSKRNIADPP